MYLFFPAYATFLYTAGLEHQRTPYHFTVSSGGVYAFPGWLLRSPVPVSLRAQVNIS